MLRPYHPSSRLCLPRFIAHLISCAHPGRLYSHTGSQQRLGPDQPARPAAPGVRTAPGPHDQPSSPVKVPGPRTQGAPSRRGCQRIRRSGKPDSNRRSPAPSRLRASGDWSCRKRQAQPSRRVSQLRYTPIRPSHDGRRDEEDLNLRPAASQTAALSKLSYRRVRKRSRQWPPRERDPPTPPRLQGACSTNRAVSARGTGSGRRRPW